MPIYYYKNKNNGEIVEVVRKFSEQKIPYISPDGSVCEYIDWWLIATQAPLGIDKNAEVFEKDSDYVKKMKPKYVKFHDGHREIYDPTKHC